MNGGVVIRAGDFFSDFCWTIGAKIVYGDPDIFAVANFEVDIFGDDRVVAVADNEELGLNALGFEGAGLVSLAFFDKASELAAV